MGRHKPLPADSDPAPLWAWRGSACACLPAAAAQPQTPQPHSSQSAFGRQKLCQHPKKSLASVSAGLSVCTAGGKVSPWCSCSRPSGRVLPSCPPLAATSAGGGGSSPPPGAARSEVSSKTHTRAASLHVWSLGLRRAHK